MRKNQSKFPPELSIDIREYHAERMGNLSQFFRELADKYDLTPQQISGRYYYMRTHGLLDVTKTFTIISRDHMAVGAKIYDKNTSKYVASTNINLWNRIRAFINRTFNI